MNIFILDQNIELCAQYHIDAHSGKMQLEAAQMLCTNHWVDKYLGYVPRKLTSEEWAVLKEAKTNEVRDFPYLPTMYNHPCTIWTRSSLDNYEWTWCYAHALAEEFRYRYGKEHKSFWQVINKLPDPVHIKRVGFTTFGLAMPEVLKNYDDPIQSYRDYYHLDKATFARWSHRPTPSWWDESLADYEQRITAK